MDLEAGPVAIILPRGRKTRTFAGGAIGRTTRIDGVTVQVHDHMEIRDDQLKKEQ